MGRIFGTLIARATGDRYELVKTMCRIGRREANDIVLPYANISGRHCLLWIEKGYWMIEDLNSTNGVRVNGVRVTEETLLPGDVLSLARHEFTMQYSPEELGADGPPPVRSGSTLTEAPLWEEAEATEKPSEEEE